MWGIRYAMHVVIGQKTKRRNEECCSCLGGAERARLPIPQRREEVSLEQAFEVPLGGRLSLEIPEDEFLGLLLEHIQLSLDVPTGVIHRCRIPGVDEVDVATRSSRRNGSCHRIAALPSRPKSVTVKSRGAISHGDGPFSNDYKMVKIGSVRASVRADVLYVFVRREVYPSSCVKT